MKKWIYAMLISGLMVGGAFGEQEPVKDLTEPSQEELRRGGKGAEPGKERARRKLTPEQRQKMEQMKAARAELNALAASARSESDPVKKEALIGQLREKLTANAERMHEEFRKRLQKAESEVEKMKERLRDAEANQATRVEEHLQKILDGEALGKGPHGKGKRPERKGPPIE